MCLVEIYRLSIEKVYSICFSTVYSKYSLKIDSSSLFPLKNSYSFLYYRYEDTAQGKAFSGLGKNFVRELYSEIENKKEYEFLRGNKELELIFEEHLK